ncbi:MAG: DUF5683 domain-containing protein [Clostridium sp.]|nr:DUF5683 domain-containing protein [Clostridium sp.]
MKATGIIYSKIIILLTLLTGFGGMSSLWAQAAFPAVGMMQETTDTEARILQADSVRTGDDRISPTDETPVDTAALSHISDSIAERIILQPRPQFTPNSQRAMWLALVLPGAGQIYNRKYWKLPIVYGGFLGCVYALTWNGQMYRDYSQAYLDIMDDDPNTKSYMQMLPLNYNIEGREERFKEIFKNKKNYYRKYRDMSIFAMIAVYALSVVDAYVDAELSSFDISKDLSLKIEPTLYNERNMLAGHAVVGVQCKLNF